jgi:L-amino acid N-acyltransferase YncA
VTELIRAARTADAPAIAAIHNQGIEERQATFETEPRTGADYVQAMADSSAPFLVAEDAGQVVGWARLFEFSPRACYHGVAEISIYIDRAARGRGLGRRLLDALAAEAERLGYWKIIGLLFPTNGQSVGLFRSAGYREVGTYMRHGRLDGEWRHVLLVERLLGEAVRDG